MKQIFLMIGMLLSLSVMGQSWERLVQVTPVLNIAKDSAMLKKGNFNYQYPDRAVVLSKEESGYMIVTENINYKYPQKAIDFTKDEALRLIFKGSMHSLQCRERIVNMDNESKSVEKWQDNIPLSCFQLKQADYSIVAVLYSSPLDCSDNLSYLFLLDKQNNVSDTLLIAECISEFDPDMGGFINLKQNTILRRTGLYQGRRFRNLYEYFEIDISRLKFKKIYSKECRRSNIKTLEKLKAEVAYVDENNDK
jgi:hypothetical protein